MVLLLQTMSSVPDIFTTGISIYCIMCVYSYFQAGLNILPQNGMSHSFLRFRSFGTIFTPGSRPSPRPGVRSEAT